MNGSMFASPDLFTTFIIACLGFARWIDTLLLLNVDARFLNARRRLLPAVTEMRRRSLTFFLLAII